VGGKEEKNASRARGTQRLRFYLTAGTSNIRAAMTVSVVSCALAFAQTVGVNRVMSVIFADGKCVNKSFR